MKLLFNSLRFRLTLLISLMIILPMLITLSLTGFQGTSILQSDATEKLSLQATALANNVNLWDKEHVKLVQNLSMQPDIVSMKAKKQKPVLEKTAGVYTNIYLFSTIGLSGLNMARSDNEKLKDYHDRPYFIEAVAGKDIARQVLIGRTTGRPSIVFSSPIRNNRGKIIGVAMLSTDLAVVTERLKAVRLGQTGAAFVIDAQGKVLAHPEAKYAAELKDFSAHPAVRALFTGHPGALTFTDNYGVNWLSHSIALENGWGVIVQQQRREILENVRFFWRFATLVVLIVSSMVSLLTWIIATHLVRPLEKLTQAAVAGAEGNLNQTITLQRNDEIGILVKAFNQMAAQLKASFETLATNNQELQRLDHLKNEFLTNTSHELRTPLNGIIGISQSLIDGAAGTLSDPVKTNLAMVVASGKRLSTLVNDILDFAKLKHHQLTLQLNPVGLREVTDVVLFLNQPLVRQKNLHLVNAINSNLPLVYADENRLQQILHNLIGNAIKFTEQGQIEISAQELDNSLVITIADTGIGIPAEQLNQIFEAFEQADGSTAQQYGGIGLGLTITKQLVELHGGTFLIKSQVERGSQFTFTLPMAPLQTAPQSAREGILTEKQLTPSSELARLTELPQTIVEGQFNILIVDDEPVNLQVLNNYLVLQSYNIVQAASGKKALALIADGFKPDLILLDVMMPQMTGYEVTRTLREQWRADELPIILLTANNQTEDLVASFDCGANDYLTKPIAKDELLVRVKTHLHLKQLQTEALRLVRAYERFVPREFLNLLGRQSIVDIQLGDQLEQEMTVLFSDIRGFTSLSEKMTPHDTFEFINNYLGQMEPVIFEYHGVIDKYMGDAIMAVFPAANDAVGGAIGMLKALSAYNQLLQIAQFSPLHIGIGLNTGRLMLGTVGGKQRMEGTVIADAVNLASRVEELTKIYQTPLLITEHTYRQLEEPMQYHIRVIDVVKVKGKSEEVTVYEVYDADPPDSIALKDETREDLELGFVLYHSSEFADAQPFFEKVWQANQTDQVAHIYLNRCQDILSLTMPEKATILVVDDMPVNVELLSLILTTNHFEVLVAHDGESALAIMESHLPQLILLDVMMPGIDGFETCQRLKMQSRTKNIPVIFMTVLTDQQNKLKGFEAGAVDYITKPFYKEEVLARIRVHLNNHYLRQQLLERI